MKNNISFLSRISRPLIAFVLITALIFSMFAFDQTYAASQKMKIHSIYLPSTATTYKKYLNEKSASPTLVESGGKFVLLNSGQAINTAEVKAYLKKVGATKLDVYVSHMHSYAYEVGLELVKDPSFTIEKIYLPSKNLANEFEHSGVGTHHRRIEKCANSYGVQLVYLKNGSSFSFGNVNVSIIGPIGTYKLSDFKSLNGKYGTTSGHYVNNYSLASKFKCGKRTFLSVGDIESSQETRLVNRYGNSLKADILELPHHGLPTSGTRFINTVKPAYTFAGNHWYTQYEGQNRITHKQRELAGRYGITYMTADEKKSLVISVTQSKIALYKGGLTGTKLYGWVKLKGGTGRHNTVDKYYITKKTLRPKTGVKRISGKYYYFGDYGRMQKASYKTSGKYNYWKKYGSGKRYYSKSGIMARGVKKIGKYEYYFKKNGIRATGIVKRGKYKYFYNKYGRLVKNKTVKNNGYKLTLDGKGRVIKRNKLP